MIEAVNDESGQWWRQTIDRGRIILNVYRPQTGQERPPWMNDECWCTTADDLGVTGNGMGINPGMIAYPHPDCPRHARTT